MQDKIIEYLKSKFNDVIFIDMSSKEKQLFDFKVGFRELEITYSIVPTTRQLSFSMIPKGEDAKLNFKDISEFEDFKRGLSYIAESIEDLTKLMATYK